MEVGNKYRERDGHKYHQRRFFGAFALFWFCVLLITEEINFMPLQDKRLKSAPKEKIELFSKTCTMSEYLSNQKHLR